MYNPNNGQMSPSFTFLQMCWRRPIALHNVEVDNAFGMLAF